MTDFDNRVKARYRSGLDFSCHILGNFPCNGIDSASIIIKQSVIFFRSHVKVIEEQFLRCPSFLVPAKALPDVRFDRFGIGHIYMLAAFFQSEFSSLTVTDVPTY